MTLLTDARGERCLYLLACGLPSLVREEGVAAVVAPPLGAKFVEYIFWKSLND